MSSSLQTETKHLKGVLWHIAKESKFFKNKVKSLEKYYADGLKRAARESKLDDAAEVIGEINNMLIEQDYTFQLRFRDRLDKQLDVPYFARVDFCIKGTKEPFTVYIGKYSLVPEDLKYQVSDWRSPIASLFYNYPVPTKDAKYEFLVDVEGRPWLKEHKKIKGDLVLRRNLDIAQGKLLALYDNNLRIDFLASEIDKKSGGQLEDIVRTIQSEQDIIIRSDPQRVCIVQGTAGSGKTTVAIHRMSYLFYTYEDYITESNTLLLSSSSVLVNYVANTLPELEIFSLTRDTLSSFLRKILLESGFTIYAENISQNHGKNSELKNSKEFIEALHEYITDRQQTIRQDIEELPHFERLHIDRYLARFASRTPYECVVHMFENFSDEKKDLMIEKKSGSPVALRRLAEVKDVLVKLRKIIKQFNPIQEYAQFLKAGYLPKLHHDIEFELEALDIDDICVIYYLGHKLRGVTHPHKHFRHVVVDEGQDLGVLNYLVISTFVEGNSFTILGDLNQSTEANGAIESWDDLEFVWDRDNIDYYDIPVSYRTTKEIITFARSILEKYPDFTYLPEPFDRHGSKPSREVLKSPETMEGKVIEIINNSYMSGDKRAIGIIVFGDQSVKSIRRVLKDNDIKHVVVDKKFDDFQKSGVYVVPEKLVKGLEFNTVIVMDPSEKTLPSSPNSAKRLFVCVTRAINNLYVLSLGKENPLLG